LTAPRSSLSFEVHDDILLLVLGRDAPRDPEWSHFVEEAGSEMERRARPVLVMSEGGHPSASQREAMNQKLPRAGVLIAVVTDSLVARGTVAVESWFGGAIRAFPKDNEAVVQALRYLGVDPSRDAAVFRALGGMLSAVTSGVPPARP
jgi:hypothetical protein